MWTRAEPLQLARFASEEVTRWLGGVCRDAGLGRGPPARRRMVEAIYAALSAVDIQYDRPQFTEHPAQQVVRQPDEILDGGDRRGTCLDLALLFSGACLAHHLLPVVVILDGHAFVLVSLSHDLDGWDLRPERDSLADATRGVCADQNRLVQMLDAGKYLAVECTGFVSLPSHLLKDPRCPEAVGRVSGRLPFERALEAGREQFSFPERPFAFAVDIALARFRHRIKAYPLRAAVANKQKHATRLGVLRVLGWVIAAVIVVGVPLYWFGWNKPLTDRAKSLEADLLTSAKIGELAGLVQSAPQNVVHRTHELLLARPTKRPAGDENEDGRTLRVRTALARALLGDRGGLRDVLDAGPDESDPQARVDLVKLLPPAGLDPNLFLDPGDPPAVRQAMVIAVALTGGSLPARDDFVGPLAAWYEADDDPGVHAAVHWALGNHFGEPGRTRLREAFARVEATGFGRLAGKDPGQRQWAVHRRSGTTFVYFPAGHRFRMGDAEPKPSASTGPPATPVHTAHLPRAFLIAMTETSWSDYHRLMSEPPAWPDLSDPQTAAERIRWVEAAEYCNRMNSRTDGNCYDLVPAGQRYFLPAGGHLGRAGFRLPTETEWEYCCRGLATTRHHFGGWLGDADARRYVGFRETKAPIGRYPPNLFGLFDTLGGVLEWCDDGPWDYPVAGTVRTDDGNVTDKLNRIARGGCYETRDPLHLSACQRYSYSVFHRGAIGFRPARTVSEFPPSE